MNFACLTKITLLSGSPEVYVQQARLVVQTKAYPGLAEIALYLAAENPQELYIVSLWHTLEQCLSAFASASAPLAEIKLERKIIKQLYFKLSWEHRLINGMPQSSFMRVLTFPADYSDARIKEVLNYLRSHRREIPGLIGSWVGLSITPPPLTTTSTTTSTSAAATTSGASEQEKYLLTRSDWLSQAAQDNYLNSAIIREIFEPYCSAEIKVEYASFNLQAVMQPHYSEAKPPS